MDVRIGLTQTPKELEVQLEDDADPAALRKQVEKVLADMADGRTFISAESGTISPLAERTLSSPTSSARARYGASACTRTE